MDFKIMDEEVWFSDEFVKLNNLRNKFLKNAFNSADEVIEKYKETFIGDEENFNEVEKFGKEIIKEYLLVAVSILKEYQIDDIDSEIFLERYYYEKYYNIFHNSSVEDKTHIPYEFNGESDLVYNNIYIKLSSVTLEEREDNKILYKLAYSIAKNIFNIHFAIIDALYDNGVKIIAKYSEARDIEKADELFQNIVSSDDKKTIVGLKKIIEINPYNEELYKFLLQKYGDEKNEVESLGEFLGYNNIKAYKETLIKMDNEEKADLKEEHSGKENSNKRKKVIKIAMFSLGGVLTGYLCATLFFTSNFAFGTIINGINAAGKSTEVIQNEVMSIADNYVLNLKGRNDTTYEIKGIDIGLKYDFNGGIQEIRDNENPFLWFSGLFRKREYSLSEGVTFDENLLRDVVDKLSCFDENNIVQPQDARIEYSNNSYQIVDEVIGNLVDKEALYEGVVNAINDIDDKIDLDESDYYINPKYTSKSKEVVDANATLNKYVASVISYKANGKSQQLDGNEINNWLEVDEDFNVDINEGKVRRYVGVLGNTFDEIGNYREFMKPNGGILKVTKNSNVTYVDREAEIQSLIGLIKEGSITTKEPTFISKITSSLNSDVVNTFVEIDLTNQHIWYYRDGALMTESDIVTGDANKNYATPPGVFGLSYKQKDATLRGPGYETPVSFWMPFNGGIGLHDATWRGAFGGSIYKNNGSHGCVNLPYNVAQIIFNTIQDGEIIICRY